MQFRKTLTQVREQVAVDDQGKWDSLVPCKDLTLHLGMLHFPQALSEGHEQGLTLTPWAMSQACHKLGMPAAYLKKCPPALQDENFNYWSRSHHLSREWGKPDHKQDEQWLLRARNSEVRGVLSSRYAKLDNHQVLDTLTPLLDGSRFQVGLVETTSESLHLRLVNPELARDVLPGDRLLVGIHIANSEVGMRACTVDALVFRLVCTNGLIRRVNHKSLLKQRHLHVQEPRFKDMLASAIQEATLVAAAFIEQLAQATTTPLPDPEHAVEQLAEAWSLSQATADMVRFALHGEAQQGTLYSLINSLTLSAQRLGIEERVEIETLASHLADATSTTPSIQQLRARILSSRK